MKSTDLFKRGIINAKLRFLLTSTLLCSSVFTISQAQSVTGGTLVIGPGAVITSTSDLSIQSGAALDVQSGGTLILKKNLTNQNATANSVGNGLIELSGTTAQAISGQNIIANLTMNNTEGVIVTGNTSVTGTLTLTGGLITLGSNNLTLGPSATVSGTPSATNMIVATGTGELRKEFTATGSFTFPVGDNTATAKYSPVILNFTSGTFGSGAYAGVNLVNDFYSGMTTPRITRNWTITQSSISSFSADATFRYVDADLDLGSGAEADLYTIKVSPTPFVTFSQTNAGSNLLAANGLTSFSTFTAAKGAHTVSLRAFFEGPYNTGNGFMSTSLNPTYLPTAQPYGSSVWAYSGTETANPIPNADITDWVLIELRQATDPGLATASFARRAALIKKDGWIVDVDGTSPVSFTNAGGIATGNNLYIVIRHRNQLSIMTASGVSKTSDVYTYDFSTALAQAYLGGSGYKQIPGTTPAVYGMVAGDIDQNGSVYVPDYTIWATNQGSAGVYHNADLDFDGNVYVPDYTKWATNQGVSNPILGPVKAKYVTAVP